MSMIQFLINNSYSIPRFCYHGFLSIAGNCRVCVIDDREMKTSVSCAMCYESYRVESFNNNAIIGVYVKNALRVRESIFEFLLLSHPLDCPICDRGGECELQDMTNSFGSDRGRNNDIKSAIKDKLFNISISTHMSRCITCGRCVRFLREITQCYDLGILGRGNVVEVSNYIYNINMSYNIYSSNIIDLCPVSIRHIQTNVQNNCINISVLYNMSLTSQYCKILLSLLLSYIITNIYTYVLPYTILKSNNIYIFRLHYSLPVTYNSRKLLDDVYECVLCASCTASCPSYWWNGSSYLGPAILLQSYKCIVDSNDSDFLNRLMSLDIGYNISLCHAIGNCEIVCPKNLNPADRISDLKSILSNNLDLLYYYD
jgi:hypothetical protein